MNRTTGLRTGLSLIAETVLLLLPSAVFLAAYVGLFEAPRTAVAPHMQLVFAWVLCLLALRLACTKLAPGRIGSLMASTLTAVALLAALGYYATVLIGLEAWGRVPTWPLVKVYLEQWRTLGEVLGYGPVAVIGPLALTSLALWGALHWIQQRLRWPAKLAVYVSGPVVGLVLFSCLGLLGLRSYEVGEGLHPFSGEPLTATFRPDMEFKAVQSSLSEGARLLDAREAQAALAYRPGHLQHPRNVIIVVGDALRRERMGLFGYVRDTTPGLTRLQSQGGINLMARIMASCAESYCGLMSIARSRPVHEFSQASLTLPRVLALHGYRHWLILGGDHTNFYGLAEALGPADLYWDGTHTTRYVNDDREVVRQAESLPHWDGQPHLIQFHLMSTHALGKRADEFVRFSPVHNYYGGALPRFGQRDERMRAWVGNFYDNGMLQFDAKLQQLLESLEERGYLQDALVVVTGDHGELLGEHGYFAHARTVLQPVLDVPLILMRFGYEGEPLRVPRLAGQIDIAPTVLHELGLPAPQNWAGVALQGAETPQIRHFRQGREVGLFDARDPQALWKFWRNLRSGEEHAYRIDLDPGEANNLVAEVPASLRADWNRLLLPAVAVGARDNEDSAEAAAQ